jgi:hypothetical protein
MTLQKRPLLDTRSEQTLFISDASRARAITRGSAPEGGNVLVSGDPGSGKTSVLFAIRARCGTKALYLNAATLDAPEAIVSALSRMLVEAELIEPEAATPQDDPLADVGEIRRWRTAPSGTRFLLDDLSVRQAIRLFGHLRDELWQTPLSFAVAARADVAKALSVPPADAFFDTRVTLEPFDAEHARALLEARVAAGQTTTLRFEREGAKLQPRELLAIAADGDPGGRFAPDRQHQMLTSAEAIGGRSAAMLFVELWGREGVSASELATATGLSRQRVAALLHQLERSKLIVAYSAPRTGRPGRPERLYGVSVP